jgi:hypothetical protein
MVRSLSYNERFYANSRFPKTFYDLTEQEQVEVVKRFKMIKHGKPPNSEEKAN